ncbi:hypothetical protein TSARBOMBA_262 [Bacillus phage TsarBomba]|uniref:Uncharacterized protein n=1 Tax=Bacillus phage TsarBomba TaxID=1690456 RepID=A0A0K2CZV6_9CAUD|nr:hypothetical protein TSARBOMBA_12 [Bacillus phage TsarBomba]YP_009207077.1 hypothetical protein TSARBOMBA_262 [Bacillus phage TsarBomba]ALA13099.1 hypothetical protein TSARBOMBA_262 [Bacillus phage TsarBomba]ALA13128.1 hypothetical protein TSARBOMBA_12 [Bacillus phage TsarBomba]
MLCRCEVCSSSFNHSWDKTICTTCEEKKRKGYSNENQRVMLNDLSTLLDKLNAEYTHDESLREKLVDANIYPSQLKDISANLRRLLR